MWLSCRIKCYIGKYYAEKLVKSIKYREKGHDHEYGTNHRMMQQYVLKAYFE